MRCLVWSLKNEFYNTYEPKGLVYVCELQCDEDTYKEATPFP